MEPLLHAERNRCENAAKELEDSQAELNHFREVLEPEYSAWFHSQFGKRATELRELHARWLELRRLVSQVEAEAMHAGCSLHTAYQRIEQSRRNMDEKIRQHSARDHTAGDEDPTTTKTKNSKRDSGRDTGDNIPPELEALLRQEFEEVAGERPRNHRDQREYDALFKEFQEAFREEVLGQTRKRREKPSNEAARPAAPERSTPPSADPEESRRKQIYRILARRLHPDVNLNLSPRELNLWHEVQLAYHSKDIQKLETLLALCESGGAEFSFCSVLSVSRLRAIFLDFRKKIRSTQKELRERKKTPAWEYLQSKEAPSGLKELKRRVARELRDAEEDLHSEIRTFEDAIDSWSRSSRKQGTKQRRPEFSYRR